MTKQDLKNFELIEKIVEKTFYLEDDSLKFFKKAIHEPISDKEVYKEILAKEDFRLRFPMPIEFYKNMDEGWRYFQEYFPDFVLSFMCTYINYRENKIIYKNNEVKLKKAIVDYYYRNKTALSHLFRLNMESAKLLEKERVESFVLERLETVGSYKLPIKSEMEIVFSLNYADWFLCSTAEGWSSCINLESDFHGCYWSGLPGIVGDPNRAMLYITDRNTKEYLGIVTEKILSRTWLLTTIDHLSAVRYFPNVIMNTETIRNITKWPILDISSHFISKHAITPLWFKNGKSSFIYSDHTKFPTKVASPNKKIIYGEGGFWHVDKATNEVEAAGIFALRTGLKELYFSDRTLERYASRRCQKCGGMVEGEGMYEFNGVLMCRGCFSRNVGTCPYCNKKFWKEEMTVVHDGDYICNGCIENYFVKCEDCKEIIHKDHITKIRDLVKSVCNACLEKEYEVTRCQTCDDAFAYKESIIELNRPKNRKEKHGEYICNTCLKIFWDIGQLKFEFVAA